MSLLIGSGLLGGYHFQPLLLGDALLQYSSATVGANLLLLLLESRIQGIVGATLRKLLGTKITGALY